MKALLVFTYFVALSYGEPLLSSSSVQVAENSSLSLTCSYSGTTTLSLIRWSLNSSLNISSWNLVLPSCEERIPVNKSLYEYTCSNGYKWNILKVSRSNQGDKWQCAVVPGSGSFQFSNIVTVDVSVPIIFVTMVKPLTDILTVKENETVEFECSTSFGLPQATVTWYKNNNEIHSGITNQPERSENLISVKSTLQFSAVRTDQGKKVFCQASNTDQRKLNSTRQPSLNVTYPPVSRLVIKEGSNYTAVENTISTFTCSVTGGNPIPILKWNCTKGDEKISVVGETVENVVTWNASRTEPSECTCQIVNFLEIQPVKVSITVFYPPSVPIFRIDLTNIVGNVSVIQNNTLRLECKSYGNPTPTFLWHNPSGGPTVSGPWLNLSNIQVASSGLYTCEAKNTMTPSIGPAITRSEGASVKVFVLYPPTVPTLYFGTINDEHLVSDKTIQVIRNDTFQVKCASAGNPDPTYRWSGQIGASSNELSVTSITESQTQTCTATNVMIETAGSSRTGTAESRLNIHVLYPPFPPVLVFKTGTGTPQLINNTIFVLENETFSIICKSESNPPPSRYSWNVAEVAQTDTLTFMRVSRSKDGTYNCTAENVMTRSFPNPELEVIGRNVASFSLEILYAPVVENLTTENVEEGHAFVKVCSSVPGNPPETQYQWINEAGNREVPERILNITSVSRSDASNFTCTASNEMKPSVGNPMVGMDSKSFLLNVLYKSTVVKFTFNGHNLTDTISENHTEVLVYCEVDSNPGSNITLSKSGETLMTVNSDKTLHYSLQQVSCTDAGKYTCSGINRYNALAHTMDFMLYVQCSPRPSPFTETQDEVRSAFNRPATMQFIAIAYPTPEIEAFVWYRKNDSQWEKIQNSTDFHVFTHELTSNLTIANVSASFLGIYKLHVRNRIGFWEQIFILRAADVPQLPVEFSGLTNDATETSVTVQWKPGFNGGLQQTFVLRYRQKNTQLQWMSVNVTHQNEEQMRFTIKNLLSGTRYDMELYALNTFGRSEGTLFITIATKDKPNGTGQTSTIIGGAVGGGTGCAIIVVLAVVFVRYLRIRKEKQSSPLQLHKKGTTAGEENSDEDDVQIENPMYVSAGPKNRTDNASPNQKKKTDLNAVYAVVDKSHATRKFTSIIASWPGSCHDSHVFRRSGLCARLQQENKSFSDGIILGDSGYPCRPFMMTPFLTTNTDAKDRYQQSHTRTRVTIERTFGQWNRKFHVLHSEIRLAPIKACRVIVACAILRNIALMLNEPNFEDDGNCDHLEVGNYPVELQTDGVAVRDFIVRSYFS